MKFHCDRCGKYIGKTDPAVGGHMTNVWFKIAENEPDNYGGHIHRSIVMCEKCWSKFEKLYNKFMEKRKKNG
jgi:hypothetical protein